MSGFRALISALAAAACAAGLTACGGEDEGGPIPRDQGDQLIAQLDEIEAEVDAGDCVRAQELALVFNQNVNNLPLGDDPELREALVTASGNLETLTEDPDQCMPETGATGETGIVPTETTTPTETTETTTTTTEPEEPEDDDEGRGPPDEPPGDGKGGPGGGNGNDGTDDGSGDDESSGGIGSGGG